MNRVIESGCLTRDPDIRYSRNDQTMAIARYTLAVDRRGKKSGGDGQQTADFISCVAFGKSAEFAEKYLRKGTKIMVEGRLQTGSYTNKDGQTVYTTDVVVENHEFCESKNSGYQNGGQPRGGYAQDDGQPQGGYQQPDKGDGAVGDGFMNIPDGLDEELPFN